jgi:hypothetical protein
MKPPDAEISQGLPKCGHVNHSPDYNYSFDRKTTYNTLDGEASVDFKGLSLKDKCRWSKACEVYWQGISDKPCTGASFKKYE